MHNYLIITGASRGIGKAIAAAFLAAGWQVLNLSRHTCDLEQVKNIPLDLAAADWETALEPDLKNSLPTTSRICLVHNAATLYKDRVNSITAEQLRQVLEVNVVAPARLNRLILPYMQAGSSIIYIGSTLSEKAVSNAFSYVTSKHAIAGMMKATCQDVAGSGIHTACICPGFTDTPMLRKHLNQDEQTLVQIQEMTAFKRLVQPVEIAKMVLFCADQPVINGAVIHANLGQIGA